MISRDNITPDGQYEFWKLTPNLQTKSYKLQRNIIKQLKLTLQRRKVANNSVVQHQSLSHFNEYCVKFKSNDKTLFIAYVKRFLTKTVCQPILLSIFYDNILLLE